MQVCLSRAHGCIYEREKEREGLPSITVSLPSWSQWLGAFQGQAKSQKLRPTFLFHTFSSVSQITPTFSSLLKQLFSHSFFLRRVWAQLSQESWSPGISWVRSRHVPRWLCSGLRAEDFLGSASGSLAGFSSLGAVGWRVQVLCGPLAKGLQFLVVWAAGGPQDKRAGGKPYRFHNLLLDGTSHNFCHFPPNPNWVSTSSPH